jgi:hypothetical protein
MRLTVRVATVLALAALVGAPVADAKFTMRFDRGSARAGEMVSVRLLRHGDGRGPWRLYLVRASFVSQALFPPYGAGYRGRPPRDARVVAVARVRKGAAVTRFRTPRVPAGRYALLASCPSCAGGSGVLDASVPFSIPDGTVVRADGSLLTIRH